MKATLNEILNEQKKIVDIKGNKYKIEKKIISDSFYSEVAENSSNILDVTIYSLDNKHIGYGLFTYDKNGVLRALGVSVNKEYRRQGIATKLYDEAEDYFNDIIYPSGSFEGDEIEKFWINRKR